MSDEKIIRVLIVDDDEDDFLLTADTLHSISDRKFEVEWAPSYQKGLERIRQCEHDVYIIDYYLGMYTGLHLIREALKAKCEEPMILLTGINNQEVDEAAAELGAFDYLLKGMLNSESLGRSIRYSLAQAAMMKAIRENEVKFRTVFEKSRDMIFIADTSGRLLSVSQSAETLTGYSAEELLQMRTSDLYADADEGAGIENALIQHGEVSGKKVDLLTKSRERRICSLYATMQSDRYGRQYCQGVLHDLTAQIREERATVMSEKMEATGRLMRMLAHEVRNPLTNIGLALEGFIGELPVEHDLHDYLDIIKRNAQRIDTLITQLLNSSKPTELHLEPLSLKDVLEETLAETGDRLALKKLAVIKEFSTENDRIMLDREKIKIAFTNIIVNAGEAMQEGSGVLEIKTERTLHKMLLSIRDNGNGISPIHLNKIFEPYFSSKPGGMGLGLASTLNIVQSHGGSIHVESQEGAGTTFFLTFNAS
ncbi:MAG: PAS domain S-box protein [Saprospiraceae bacterium]|nr:PAS domain S-box protein [Saprospiraceae bacterium]